MAALIETVAEKPGHPILDAADPACPDGKAIARHLGHSWEAVLLDDSAPESPGGRPWDRLPPVVLDTGGIHLSRLPLATRLACDAKSLVAALRVGSDEYPSWTQPPHGRSRTPVRRSRSTTRSRSSTSENPGAGDVTDPDATFRPAAARRNTPLR